MRCPHCKSVVVFRFFDAYGQRRIFCRNCKGSFLEENVPLFGNPGGQSSQNQKSLMNFRPEVYWKPEAVRQAVV